MGIKIKYQCMMVRKDVTYKPVASFFFKWGRGRQTHPKNLNVLNKNIKKKNKKGYFSNSQNHEKYNPGDGGGGVMWYTCILITSILLHISVFSLQFLNSPLKVKKWIGRLHDHSLFICKLT